MGLLWKPIPIEIDFQTAFLFYKRNEAIVSEKGFIYSRGSIEHLSLMEASEAGVRGGSLV